MLHRLDDHAMLKALKNRFPLQPNKDCECRNNTETNTFAKRLKVLSRETRN